METIIGIIFAIFGILQIILFFKIWGMTNDIKEIKEKYLYGDRVQPIQAISEETNNYSNGLLVVELKTERQMRLGDKLENGKYNAYSNGALVGEFLIHLNLWSLKSGEKKSLKNNILFL